MVDYGTIVNKTMRHGTWRPPLEVAPTARYAISYGRSWMWAATRAIDSLEIIKTSSSAILRLALFLNSTGSLMAALDTVALLCGMNLAVGLNIMLHKPASH